MKDEKPLTKSDTRIQLVYGEEAHQLLYKKLENWLPQQIQAYPITKPLEQACDIQFVTIDSKTPLSTHTWANLPPTKARFFLETEKEPLNLTQAKALPGLVIRANNTDNMMYQLAIYAFIRNMTEESLVCVDFQDIRAACHRCNFIDVNVIDMSSDVTEYLKHLITQADYQKSPIKSAYFISFGDAPLTRLYKSVEEVYDEVFDDSHMILFSYIDTEKKPAEQDNKLVSFIFS